MSNEPIHNQQPPYVEEDEIDLIALAKTLWEGRRTVIKTTLIFMAIGLFVAIFSQKEYTASTTIVPQTSKSTKLGGNLSGLAAMAGINLGSMESDSGISPLLYPEIVSSIPFQLELLQTPLTIEGLDEKVSYTDYYTNIYSPGLLGYLKKYTIGVPGLILKALNGKPVILSGVEGNNQQPTTSNHLLSISNEEFELIEQLTEQISLDVNVKEGYVTLSASMPEAIAAAEFVEKAQQLLQDYIIKFKIQKSIEQLKFIDERYAEKEKTFKSIQNKLANFRDRNQNVTTAVAQTKLQSLQSEYDLAYGVYSELAKQLESQQIQVKEDTPVFTILKPVSIPNETSKPKRKTILIIWMFFGGVLGIGMVYGKVYLSTLKEKWKNN